MNKFLLLLITVSIATGCASQSNKLNVERVKETERIFIGKFDINFNGLTKDDLNCELFINSEYKPTLKISDDGYVFYKTIADSVTFDQIACWDEKNELESRWYNFDLPYKTIKAPEKENIITYFGDIKISWDTSNVNNSEKPLKRSMTTSPSESFQSDIERVHNAGKFKISISDNAKTTSKAFLEKNPSAQKTFHFQSNVLLVKDKYKH